MTTHLLTLSDCQPGDTVTIQCQVMGHARDRDKLVRTFVLDAEAGVVRDERRSAVCVLAPETVVTSRERPAPTVDEGEAIGGIHG